MKKIESKKYKSAPKNSLERRRSSIVQKVSKIYIANVYENNTLKRVSKHLYKLKRKTQAPVKQRCPAEDLAEDKIDHQVRLRCRQLTTVVQELRKAIMRQDWDEATTLLLILCYPGLKYYDLIIIRACFVLLCNHPRSNLDLLKNFIREMTEYVLEEDIDKFIRILFVLKKSGLEYSEKGRFKRNTGDNKVTMNPEFDEL